MPEDADQEKISAEVSDGVLKIEIPKTAKEEKKDDVKHIKVCAKCHHEGKCLKGIKLDCDDFKPCDKPCDRPCDRCECENE